MSDNNTSISLIILVPALTGSTNLIAEANIRLVWNKPSSVLSHISIFCIHTKKLISTLMLSIDFAVITGLLYTIQHIKCLVVIIELYLTAEGELYL